MSKSDKTYADNTRVTPSEAKAARKRVIGLYGIPGSGKSFLLDQLRQSLSAENFEFLEGSEMINSVVPGGLKHFKTLDEGDKNHWRRRAIKQVRNTATGCQTAIIAGHSMFWKEEEPSGISVMTTDDLEIYTHIFYLDIPADLVAERRERDEERSRPRVSVTHLAAWQQSEKRLLQHQCYEHGILFSVISDRSDPLDQVIHLLQNLDRYSEVENCRSALEALQTIANDAPHTWKTLLIMDADKTLTDVDTGELFWNKVRETSPLRISDSPLKDIFGSKLQYTHAAFVQAMLLYETTTNEQEFSETCEAVASDTKLYPEFVSLLQTVAEYDHIGAIIVTSGLGRIWEIILDRHGLSHAIKVIGGGRLANGFIVSGKTKADLVRYVKRLYNPKVYAFGDSPLDLEMLQEADRAIVVVGDERTRSKSMEDSLRKAIDSGEIQARQVMLPSTVSPRLSLHVLPATSLTGADFFREVFGPKTQTALRVNHATQKNATKLLMTPMRDASVGGVALREAHRHVGRYLATELLPDASGVEELSVTHVQGNQVPGYRIMHEQQTLIVALMRGGEPMAFGVNEVLPSAMFLHASQPEKIGRKDLRGRLSVILVDSVVNSGDSLMAFIKHIRELHATIRIVAMAGVVHSDVLVRLGREVHCHSNFFLITLRFSENKFTGRGSTDTGNRLFNTTHLD